MGWGAPLERIGCRTTLALDVSRSEPWKSIAQPGRRRKGPRDQDSTRTLCAAAANSGCETVISITHSEPFMKYVNLGDTGLSVSRICLGCMSYGVSTST